MANRECSEGRLALLGISCESRLEGVLAVEKHILIEDRRTGELVTIVRWLAEAGMAVGTRRI